MFNHALRITTLLRLRPLFWFRGLLKAVADSIEQLILRGVSLSSETGENVSLPFSSLERKELEG